jgi:bromodomain adjacent to zinc finger domain protein 1A
VFVDIQGDKFVYPPTPYTLHSLMPDISRFWATVVQVFPPKLAGTDVAGPSTAAPTNHASTSTPTSPESDLSPMSDDEPQPIHNLSGDLKIPAKDVNAKDDPFKYFYKVQILEEQNEKSQEKSRTTAKDRAKWNGSLMEVQCNVMRYEVVHDPCAWDLTSAIYW